ncbi:hypothetical protein F2Q69_00059844 [Brassica cretica]|uniref:Uncharacterized protein n=1 Tax=Brassica cretica TaxID=69181 RepID=A0A8S9RDK9_BRACR|nr:hypothetical protein F2Q69_00059844 [Brassica cretica]
MEAEPVLGFEGLFSLIPLTNLSKLKVFNLSGIQSFIKITTVATKDDARFLAAKVSIRLKYCNLEEFDSFSEEQ